MNIRSGETQVRLFALVFGFVYVLVGIVGFFPVFRSSPPSGAPTLDVTTGYGYLLGLFPINLLHNVVHLLVGLGGIAAYGRFSAARAYSRTLFLVYGLLTFLGFIPQADVVFGLIPIFGNDTWLHAGSALVAAYFGFVAAERTSMEGAHEAA